EVNLESTQAYETDSKASPFKKLDFQTPKNSLSVDATQTYESRDPTLENTQAYDDLVKYGKLDEATQQYDHDLKLDQTGNKQSKSRKLEEKKPVDKKQNILVKETPQKEIQKSTEKNEVIASSFSPMTPNTAGESKQSGNREFSPPKFSLVLEVSPAISKLKKQELDTSSDSIMSNTIYSNTSQNKQENATKEIGKTQQVNEDDETDDDL